ncbi:hypothetical protein LCI18_002092 [Fusarium solani-melongenae]|uniref:Uncharacterized protein n=1 Tax=Fusarium solani subsp. cucurbitae TaxID=2747967 RepID=A0ACD3YQ76_FUSSC|nr:hypothetical protein LCI18_002092 [Fusarium solani-melongenae]
MDVSCYAAKPEAYDALSAYQIAKFFKEHGLARDEIDCFATNLLGCPVSATPVQGATSYTVFGDEAAQVVQFRGSQLPMRHIEVAKQLYGDFVPESWINKSARTLEPPPGLLGEYFKILDEVSPGLPAQLQATLDDVRQELPRLFQSSYPMVLQHDDLLENNIHVDEATGHITGIIDWADAKIAPFGVSLANMEVVLAFGNYFGKLSTG